ncbi:MAG TPA: amino acid permease C-terminal domain-containing protein, partial [Chitinophagaceae bacterium]|nr:amino acid permease C-terminal domain-containing protein [Chitinophagaceae bacterium]
YIYPLMLLISIIIIYLKVPSHFTNDIWVNQSWPMALFWLIAIVLAVLVYIKKFSLIPVLGMISCFYLMAQETHLVWGRFIIWLLLGLVVYFLYGKKHSKLNFIQKNEPKK